MADKKKEMEYQATFQAFDARIFISELEQKYGDKVFRVKKEIEQGYLFIESSPEVETEDWELVDKD